MVDGAHGEKGWSYRLLSWKRTPFSFSAIINGYSEKDFLTSGWPVINSYLKQREAEEFGFPGVQVTHAWTQNKDITKRLVRACNIPNPVEKLEDMIGEIDAVIIARDDWKSHHKLAKPFWSWVSQFLLISPSVLTKQSLNILVNT